MSSSRRSCASPPERANPMNITPSRLALARGRRGLTLVGLSKKLNHAVKPKTLSSYESGNTSPDDDTLRLIAAALAFPIDFFTAPELTPAPVDGVSFRALTKMTAAQREVSIATGTLAVAFNTWLDEKFTLPDEQVPESDPAVVEKTPSAHIATLSPPEAAATQVRASWGLADQQPIMNMTHLVEAHGVRLFAIAPDCKDVDAFSFWSGGTPFVCVDPTWTAERMRFDIAHELGHLVMHRTGQRQGRQAELEANRFASALLMPRLDVIARAPKFPSFDVLVADKKRWNVSAAALNFRLHELGITSDWHYRELSIELSRYGRRFEPDPSPHEHSYVVTNVLAALRSEGIRRDDIARELHLHPGDLDVLIAGLTVTGIDGDGQPEPTSTPPQGRHLRIVAP